jgi:hypothetical protein
MIKVGHKSGLFPKFALYMNASRVISILATQVFRNLKERDSFKKQG